MQAAGVVTVAVPATSVAVPPYPMPTHAPERHSWAEADGTDEVLRYSQPSCALPHTTGGVDDAPDNRQNWFPLVQTAPSVVLLAFGLPAVAEV